MKLVHHFASNQIELVSVLTTSWSPLAGASDEVIDDVRAILGNKQDQGVNDIQSALEVSHLPCITSWLRTLDVAYKDGNLLKRQKVCRLSDSSVGRERYLLGSSHLFVICPPDHRCRQLQAPYH
jgi:hypothetical protein